MSRAFLPRMLTRAAGEEPLMRSRNSPNAFGEFYDRMAPRVLRWFLRHTGEPHLALDLTAETFARAFEKRSEFRGSTEEEAAGWLWAIARAELAHLGRSRRVEFAALNRLGLERPAPDEDELMRLEELAVIEEVRENVGAALAELPSEQREVVRMRFDATLSYGEIAERLGVSEEVVRARNSRALRSLRANVFAGRAATALEIS